jgi:hypothetical protein
MSESKSSREQRARVQRASVQRAGEKSASRSLRSTHTSTRSASARSAPPGPPASARSAEQQPSARSDRASADPGARGDRAAPIDHVAAGEHAAHVDRAESGDVAALRNESRARQLLTGGTPREILCRIVQGDPLGMRDRVARALHADAYLLDADRVQLRSLARCARFASHCCAGDLEHELDSIVSQAIEDLLREDAEPDGDSESGSAPISAAFVALARPLGLEPEAMRRACACFNQLCAADRKAFFDLVIDGASLDDLARRNGESASEIGRRARKALDLLLHGQGERASEREQGQRKPVESIERTALECDERGSAASDQHKPQEFTGRAPTETTQHKRPTPSRPEARR